MRASFWLAWRELARRKLSFITGTVMISVVVALCVSTELMSRAREVAVAAEIDHIGPALRLIPAEKTASDLAKFDLGSTSLTRDYVRKLQRRFFRRTRALDSRLLVKIPLEGMLIHVAGIDPGKVITSFEALRRLSDNEVVLGKELAFKIGKKAGDEIFLKDEKFYIVTVLPQTANIDDITLFLPLDKLHRFFGFSDVVNEIRLYPAKGVQVETIISDLKAGYPEISIINMHRGDTAEYEMNSRLSQHRHVLYAIMAVVIALCILIWSYLSASERKIEIATLIAVGGTAMTVIKVLVWKSIIVASLGAILGYITGMAIVVVQDFESAKSVIWSLQLFFMIFGGAVLISILGALPVSLFSAFQEHVALLQE